MRIRGECHRYQFGSKDVFRTTFGKNKTMLANPGFTGGADVCLVRADGTAVVYPDGCKNIGPALAVLERKQVVDLPKRPLVVITTTIAPREPEGSSVSAPFFYWPAPTYSGGNTNIRVKNSSRSAASATATTKGKCTICAPSPKH